MVKEFYFFFFSSIIIFLNIYFRLFREKEEVVCDENYNLTFLELIITLFFSFFHISIIFYLIYNKYRKTKKEFRTILFFNKCYSKFYLKPLQYVYNQLAPKIPGSGRVILFIEGLLEKGNVRLRYNCYHYSFILFIYLPQLLVSSTLLIEILVYKKLHIFYFSLFLLLIPLLYNFFISLSLTFYENNNPGIEDVVIAYGEEMSDLGLYKKYNFCFQPLYRKNTADALAKVGRQWLSLHRINFHVKNIKKNNEKWSFYINLLSSFFYLIGFLVKLFILFY